MGDKKDPPAQENPKQGAYSDSSTVEQDSGNLFRRFMDWLAPPEGESAPSSGESPPGGPLPAEQESFTLKLILPGGGKINLEASRARQSAPGLMEIDLEPPPENPVALLNALEGYLGVPGSGSVEYSREAAPAAVSTKIATEDALPAVVPVVPPAARDYGDDVTPLPEPPAGMSLPFPDRPTPPPADPPKKPAGIEDMVGGYGNVDLPDSSSGAEDMFINQDGGMAAQIDMQISPADLPALQEMDDGKSSTEINLDMQIQASLDAHAPGTELRDEDIQFLEPEEGDKAFTDDLSLPKNSPSRPPPTPPEDVKKEGAPAIIGRSSPLVGFDFGTSYSAVAVYDDGFKLVEDENGEVQMPSVVSFPSADYTMIGTEARDRMSSEAQWTITSPKRLLGRPYKDPKVALQLGGLAFKTFAGSDKFARFEAHGEIYSVGDICAMILKEMIRRANRYLGADVKRAVFAVPVSHGSIQRSALNLAARQAGIEVVGLLTEPSASVLAHGIRGRKGTVAVYDFGGETFDFCVLKVRETAFQVLCAGGEPWLGGDDFDTVLANHISGLFQKQTGIDLRTRAVELQALLFACEGAKRELSAKQTADLRLRDLVFTSEGKKGLRYRLSRRQFDKLASHLVKKSLLISEKVLAQAGLKPSDVDTVVMSGGTSMIPLVRERVAEFFDLKPLVGEPDLAVVKGTALRAAELDGVPIDSTSLSGRTLREIAGRTIGVGIKGGPTVTLIERSMPLPAEVDHSFPTQKDGQTQMVVGLYEESKSRIDESKTIGHLRYKGIKPAPAGERKVDFNFLLDEDGMLHVTAVVEGKEFHKTIKLG